MVKGKQMKQINSKSGSRKRIAVDALKKEFDKKKEKLRCCQDEPYKFKLQPILRHLANHYEVNFVIHSLKQSVFFISCKPNNNKSNLKLFLSHTNFANSRPLASNIIVAKGQEFANLHACGHKILLLHCFCVAVREFCK